MRVRYTTVPPFEIQVRDKHGEWHRVGQTHGHEPCVEGDAEWYEPMRLYEPDAKFMVEQMRGYGVHARMVLVG